MTAVDEVRDSTGERGPRRRRERAERGFTAVRTALTAWLSRPLADFHLILATCGTLGAIGIVMVLSASSVSSYSPGSDSSVYALFQRHLLFCVLGAVVFWLGVRVPLKRIRALSSTGVVVCLGLLALVLTPLGSKINGSQGWFVIGPLSLQPVEVAKVALALWGAHILVVKYQVLHQWRHLLVPLVPVALLMFALVMAQPDLGGTITLGVVLVALLWFAGAPKRLFAVIFAGGVAGAVLLALIAEYRLDRIMSFLNPDADPLGKGLQANQALYALADGGLFGKGLGQGQSKWMYLPNVQHDFIFALIGEELGFVGCLVVIGLFGLLAFVGLRIAVRNLDPWIRIVAGTLTVWLVAQAAINIGYVVGLLPVTGVTLPMISYGGTSLLVTMLLFGILANCARHEPEAVAALRTQGPGKFGRLMRLPAPDPYRPPSKRRGSGRSGQAKGGRPAPRSARSAAAPDRRRAAPEYGRRSTPRGGTRRGSSTRRGHR
ncbi:putative lipid II flippase FtsW [Prauserella sp. PE36]|uniref:Probable peptidoglycan glycosyltransferase FtsW n=1 Tax=Prauserella endophytica TaxID=1592324 RepID=A0ABY2S1T7_9PSEU|nr:MULTISPECIES: putative lipid II flippase FtsW [Prauserella]PXY24949.1 cell division protein FtsW [Prauserella coralliicola]RBM20295.1 putative lipid II flippase FtsW [Prauserella sp. PE36]TKG66711.1 putative lipid II flippase FtsW [Prauserella endophytica]